MLCDLAEAQLPVHVRGKHRSPQKRPIQDVLDDRRPVVADVPHDLLAVSDRFRIIENVPHVAGTKQDLVAFGVHIRDVGNEKVDGFGDHRLRFCGSRHPVADTTCPEEILQVVVLDVKLLFDVFLCKRNVLAEALNVIAPAVCFVSFHRQLDQELLAVVPVIVLSFRRHPVLSGDAVPDADHELPARNHCCVRLFASFISSRSPLVAGTGRPRSWLSMWCWWRCSSRPASLPASPSTGHGRRYSRSGIVTEERLAILRSPFVVSGEVGRRRVHAHCRSVRDVRHCFLLLDTFTSPNVLSRKGDG